ncbi:MAG TPA: hypothetical protein DD643_00865, partial [Synechococcus sp. UBA8638]|nr:hypothetical protein [Synechococcus sp. UBA8638]
RRGACHRHSQGIRGTPCGQPDDVPASAHWPRPHHSGDGAGTGRPRSQRAHRNLLRQIERRAVVGPQPGGGPSSPGAGSGGMGGGGHGRPGAPPGRCPSTEPWHPQGRPFSECAAMALEPGAGCGALAASV